MVTLTHWVSAAFVLVPLSLAVPTTPTPKCAQKPMVPDGGFESGTLGQWYQNEEPPDTITVVSGGYNNSKYAALFNATTDSTFVAMIEFNVKACNDTKYLVAFAYKRLYTSKSCYLYNEARQGEFEGNSNQRNITESSQPGQWEMDAVVFDSYDSQDYSIRIGLGCDGNVTGSSGAAVLIDDIHMVNIGKATPRPP